METKDFKLEGAKEVMDALKELPAELQAKILKSFITKAGKKFIVEPLKAKLHYSKATEDTIQVVGIPGNKLAVSAGVTSKGYKLRWTDLGTEQRATKKGYNRGKITGKHQIQPTIEEQIEPIINYAEEELANEVNKILERRLKRMRKG